MSLIQWFGRRIAASRDGGRPRRPNRPGPGDGRRAPGSRGGASAASLLGRWLGRSIAYLRISVLGWRLAYRRVRHVLRPDGAARRFARATGTLLMAFGAALLLLGGGVRVSREVELAQAQRARPTPVFEQVVRVATPMPTLETVATPALPDRLVIPSVKLDTDIVEVGWTRVVNGDKPANVWETANYAAGFHTNSAPPGTPGNTVISGHNNIKGSVFAKLHEVSSGDRLYVYDADGEQHVYAVEENFVVREEGATPEERRENARWIDATDDERLTLVTCYPPWSNTHRTIVIARPVDAAPLPSDPILPDR